MKTGKVAILTMDEVAADVREFVSEKIRDSAESFLDAGPHFWMDSAKGLTARDEKGNYLRQKDMVQAWCDYCSVKFFETNGDDVNEVLVDVTTSPDVLERIWLASFR